MAALRVRALIVLVSAFAGCSVVEQDLGPPVLPVESEFENGETHYGEVLRALGPPDRLSSLSTGMVFLYQHLFLTESTIGVSVGRGSFDLSTARLTAKREAALFVFDNQGILHAHGFGQRVDDLGSGAGASLLGDADHFVSSADIDEDGGPYGWGLRMLEELPRTLNDEQSPSLGDAGLQERGAPTKAGQETLELR